MPRTPRSELEHMAALISRRTGIPMSIEYAYGQPRLISDGGARDVSPRLPAKELYRWMSAFLDGYDLCMHQHGK